MSISSAQMYARRARDADTPEEVGENTKKAIDQLVSVIRELEARITRLESKR